MTTDPLAGQPAPPDRLIDPERVRHEYYSRQPDPGDPSQRVRFGTSGHRGSSLKGTFNEAHIVAIVQAVSEHRRLQHVDGPLYLGADTHALSEPAFRSALEVLAAHDVDVVIDSDDRPTPTPVVSHAILTHNRDRTTQLADGIVITPSHNPPEDGGIKYDPPEGGPADPATTTWIEDRANALMSNGLAAANRIPYDRARHASTTHGRDYRRIYVDDLISVVDLEPVKAARLTLGVDPLGGASTEYWGVIAERYGLQLTVVNPTIDPRFGFMTLDWDGRIRMDCSSPYAMAPLIALRNRFDLAFGNDPDADRHGIVTRSRGLMNPNHYLAAAIDYLFTHRPVWRSDAAVGKTVVSSSIIDRVTTRLGRRLVEVPVGFKWFVSGLIDGSLGFGGEESAGASFLRKNGTVWTTDKDGIIMALLAAEILAVTGRDPSKRFVDLTTELGTPFYERIDASVTPHQKQVLLGLTPADVSASELAGDAIIEKSTTAPGNGEPFGGLKVVTAVGWFAVRPSGTEDVYKLYAESFRSQEHLQRIQAEAQGMLAGLFASSASLPAASLRG